VSSRTVALGKYGAALADGAWHEVAVPLAELIPAPGFAPESTYELRVLSDGAAADLEVDDIGFDNAGDPAKP
jgi:hypothetical protein